VVSINADTGVINWAFQEVAHDLWDLDVPSPPVLTTITRQGKRIDVVAAVTKIGNTLLLERDSGKPIFDYRLKRAPVSTIPGEQTAAYQPALEVPEPLSKLVFEATDITDLSESARQTVLRKTRGAKFSFFEPPVLGGKVVAFGLQGGGEWPGAAVDPRSAVLYVPPRVRVTEPLHVLSAIGDGGVDTSHVLVVLGEGAEATVLTETAGGGAAGTSGGFHCGGMEIVVGPNAMLRMVNLQNWNTGVWHFARQKAVVHAGGRLQWTLGALGSRLSQVAQDVALVGRGADAQVNGVMFTEGRQQLVYNTLQHHEAPGCKSDLLYKGGLQDRSRLVWRGMIKVDKAAQKTDGYQRNDNLMLSREARADSIPGLEIEADDVRCTHGATSGRVDEEQIFYAQARGLSADEAARLVVAGFFQQVFDRITIAPVREALARTIGSRIRRVS
jgi:FeS assembly protein SufD